MSRATYIDLRERFGDDYRIEHEESYFAERSEFRTQEEPWLQIIPCQYGHICPWRGELLAACTNSRRGIAKRLQALPFVQIAQDGDDGVNATFPVENFQAVADIMRPRRRRHCTMTPEQRAALAERGRAYRFTALQGDSDGQGRAQSTLVDILT